MTNLISASLSEAEQKQILSCLQNAKSKLSFCIKLSPEQKQTLPKMNDGRVPFVQKSIKNGKLQPVVVPPYIDLDQCSKDVELYTMLSPIETEILSLAEMIVDTRIAAGSDAFLAALSIYKSAQGAAKAGIPGTKTIVDDLKPLFDGQGKIKATEVK